MFVYVKVSKDKYRLIEAIADTAEELAQIVGTTKATIYSSISHGYKTFEKVEINDE